MTCPGSKSRLTTAVDPHVSLPDFLRRLAPHTAVSLESALSLILNDSPVSAQSSFFHKLFFPLSLSLLSCDMMGVV